MKSASIAIGAYSAMVWRCMMGAAIMAPLWWRLGEGMPDRPTMRLHLLRSAISAMMATLFFWGLERTPLAEAIALSFIAPLVAPFLASVILGEQISRRSIIGSLLATAGVAVIGAQKFGADYSDDARAGMAAVLASALLYALNLVLQRKQAQQARPIEITFFQNLFAGMFLLPFFALWGAVPNAGTAGLILLSAVLAIIALLLISWSYARAEAQVLVPVEYSAFIWAAGLGWLMFEETLSTTLLSGVIMIVAGCLVAVPRAAKQGPQSEQTSL